MNPLVLLLLAGGAFALYAASRNAGNAQAAPPPPPPPPGAPPIDVVGPPPAVPPEYTGVTTSVNPGSEWEHAQPTPVLPPGPGGGWTQASWQVPRSSQQVVWMGGRPWVWTARGWNRLY